MWPRPPIQACILKPHGHHLVPPLVYVVGYCGGSSLLDMSLCCCVGLMGRCGHLWMLVGMVGHRGVWMLAGGSEYVGRDGGAHQ